jgi:hypothetical protein
MQPDYSPLVNAVVTGFAPFVLLLICIGAVQVAFKLMFRSSKGKGRRGNGRTSGKGRGNDGHGDYPRLAAINSRRIPDAAEQLRIVMASEFRPKRLLNKGEA